MHQEEFILRQLKRNNRIYSVCRKVFLVAFIVFAAAFIATFYFGMDQMVKTTDFIIMLVILIQYPILRRSWMKTEQACMEMEAALASPENFSPDGYSSITKAARSKVVCEPKKLLISAVLIAILFAVSAGGVVMIVWINAAMGMQYFSKGSLLGIILFSIVSLLLLILTIQYLKDWSLAKKFRETAPDFTDDSKQQEH